MVDTIRLLADLQALFPDNAGGLISPQDLRDFLVSSMPTGRSAQKLVASVSAGDLVRAQSDYLGDGTADDVQIQQAIDALPTGGGVVQLSRGTFTCDPAALTLRDGLTLKGQGLTTIVKLRDAANGRLITSSASLVDVTFEDMVFDGNGINQTNGAARDDRSLLFLSNITNFTTYRVLFKNGRHGACLRLSSCNNHHRMFCRFLDNGLVGAAFIGDHAFISNSDNFICLGCLHENATDTGTAQDGIHYSTVLGNIYKNCELGVSVSNSTTRFSQHNVVKGNIVQGRGGDSGTANAAVTTTDTTLTDTREAWTTNQWIGYSVICNGKTMTITSNTATTLTGASWSGGGNPGNGFSWGLGGSVGIKVSTFGNPGPGNIRDVTLGDNEITNCDRGYWIEEVDRCKLIGGGVANCVGANTEGILLGGSVGGVVNILKISDLTIFNSVKGFKFATNGTINKLRVKDIDFNTVTTLISGTIPTDARIHGLPGTGYVTENSGIATGTSAQQTIAHGLSATPTRVYLSDIETSAAPFQSAAADATNIFITALLNADYVWKAEVV